MADPNKYTPSYDFSDFEADNPTSPKPGAELDIEFANIAEANGAAVDAIKDIRRSDGALKNGIVGPDQISAALSIGFTAQGQWQSDFNYSGGDGVIHQGIFYKALIAHRSTDENEPTGETTTFWERLFSLAAVNIEDNSISGAKLEAGAVGTRELASGGVTTDKLSLGTEALFGLREWKGFKTVTDLQADNNDEVGYVASGAKRIVSPGDIIEAQGFRYEVVAADATDFHVETAGGVKLLAQPIEGFIQPVQFGSPTGAGNDSREYVQKVLDIAPSLSATVLISEIYDLRTFLYTGGTPDGAAGDVCLHVREDNVRVVGRGGGKLISPRNSHTLYALEVDDFEVTGVGFDRNDLGTAGSIGHHIPVHGKCLRPKIWGNKFFDGDDCSVSIQPHFNKWKGDAGINDGADVFSYGSEDLYICNNHIEGNGPSGDAGIEIMAATGGIVAGNIIRNVPGHGIRAVGFQRGVVAQNDVYDCATINGYFAIAAQSGGWVVNGRYFIFENKGTLISSNNGYDCSGGVCVGIGECPQVIGNSFYGAYFRPIALVGGVDASTLSAVYIDPDMRSVINPVILNNVVELGASVPAINCVINNTTENYDFVVGGKIAGNTLAGAGSPLIQLSSAMARPFRGLQVLGNNLVPSDVSNSSTQRGVFAIGLIDCQFERNTLAGRSGLLTVCATANQSGTLFQRIDRIRVTRSSNALVSQVGAQSGWVTGMRVKVETTGTAPAPLTTTAIYYLIVDDGHSFRLASSEANAVSGVGTALSDGGTGVHWIVTV